MTRLIDVEEVCKEIDRFKGYLDEDMIARLKIAVKRLPIVDAEPVRHGRWIEVDVGDCCYRCSECGFIRDAYLLDISNYCPKCGAKMDITEEEDNDEID